MICLSFYQIFLAHFRSKKKDIWQTPKFDSKYQKSPSPTSAITINKFYPNTYISKDFDPKSVIKEIT